MNAVDISVIYKNMNIIYDQHHQQFMFLFPGSPDFFSVARAQNRRDHLDDPLPVPGKPGQ